MDDQYPRPPFHEQPQPGLSIRARLAGEPGGRQCDVRAAAFVRALRHGQDHFARNRTVPVDQPRINAQKTRLCRVAVCHEACLEDVAVSFDVGKQRTQQAARAALRRGQGKIAPSPPSARNIRSSRCSSSSERRGESVSVTQGVTGGSHPVFLVGVLWNPCPDNAFTRRNDTGRELPGEGTPHGRNKSRTRADRG